MKTYKVFFTDSSFSIFSTEKFIGHRISITKDIEEADLVIFTGGADVSPSFYGQSENNKTSTSILRDIKEYHYFKKCLNKNIPMIGVCRGAQFLCVMSGGSLIQHVEGHSGRHSMELSYDPFGKGTTEITVTSTHHQMMDLREMSENDYMILGYSLSLSKVYEGEKEVDQKESLVNWSNSIMNLDKKDTVVEPEMVYFPSTNCFCMQFHPEYAEFENYTSEFGVKSTHYIAEFIRDFLTIKVNA